MNTYLRTSTIGSDGSKKISEIKVSVLILPPTNTFTKENGSFEICEAFKTEYSDAVNVDKQVLAVNSIISKFIQHTTDSESDKRICQMLTDLYFHAPPKHPVRNSISKALHRVVDTKRDLVIESMSTTISDCNEKLSEMLEKGDSKVDVMHEFIVSLTSCFENFSEAVCAIGICCLQILPTLNKQTEIYMNILRENKTLSPAQRSETYNYLHNAIRVTLSCVQHFPSRVAKTPILEKIVTSCWIQLIENEFYLDLPMDTKINSAILKVVYDRTHGNIFEEGDQILDKFESAGKKMYYAIAVINTMEEQDLKENNVYIAFKIIVQTLFNYSVEKTTDSAIVVCATRAFVHFTKKINLWMRKSIPISDVDKPVIQATVQECLHFVWLNVQHSIESVRHFTKDLLKNLLRLGHEHSEYFGDLITETISIAKGNRTNDSLFCLILDYLSQVLRSERVLKEIPAIQQRVLERIFNDSCWSLSYERLMVMNATEIEYDMWCERWIHPLLQVEAGKWKHDFTHLNIIRNLFECALKTKPEAADFILAKPDVSIEIYLFVLWTMRKTGRVKYSPQNWQASADQKVVFAKMHHVDDIRILALRILVECHKTSEIFPIEDLNEVLEFIRHNCNTQNPSVRQQIQTTMKRATERIECGYFIAKRTPQPSSEQICRNYEEFLRKLIFFCVDSCLIEGANFGRRTNSLKILYNSIETYQKLMPNDYSIYSDSLWIKLQKTLSDSYEINKIVANDILSLCAPFYKADAKMLYTLKELEVLICSFRPADTNTASHYVVFAAFRKIYFKDYCDALLWCENLLNSGLEVAKKSLFEVPRYNSLYGAVMSIRKILSKIDLSKVNEPNEVQLLREFFTRFISKCRELTEVVAPVVNSAAPEGYLPTEWSNLSSNDATLNGNFNEKPQFKVTPQVILLYAWRAVREVSLLLGEVSLRISINSPSNPNGLITEQQLLKIGTHLQQLLIDTRHRGAFEQTFVGFSNLCLRMWRCHQTKLHSFPIKIVKKIVSIVSNREIADEEESDYEVDFKKLCFTRRSAGIPFMIQAIVTSEIQVCAYTALQYCMSSILHIAKTSTVVESRTHSLNILRALFRCTELGEIISEFVSDGVECSMRGYSALTWPERNSSTLLFSALITRIFGVQRTREIENINLKNKMTGRIFFLKFPRLYDFFLEELKEASEAIKQNGRPPRLHPLLLLISRLYPSALEGCQSNLRLSTYIPFISICSSSPELVTRQLSAKAMVALIPPINVVDRLFSILEELEKETSVNAIHGFLLQIYYLIRSNKSFSNNINDTFKQFITKFCKLEAHQHPVIRKTFIEIILEILLSCQNDLIDDNLLVDLLEIRNQFYSKSLDRNELLLRSFIQKPFTIFNLLLSAISDANECYKADIDVSSVIHIESTAHYELLDTLLNIRYLMLAKLLKIPIECQDYSRYELELVDFLHARNQLNADKILALLPSETDLYHIVDNRSEFRPSEVIKSYHILSIVIKFKFSDKIRKITAAELIELMDAIARSNDIDELSNAGWKFIAAHLSSVVIEQGQLEQILQHAQNISRSYNSLILRETSAETASIICSHFKSISSINMKLLIKYGEFLLCLLRDDSEFIRNKGSAVVLELLDSDDLKQYDEKVISSAAEDYLLQWLDDKFVEAEKENAWRKWYDLLKLVNETMKDEAEWEDCDMAAESDNMDLFQTSKLNSFGEIIFVSHKCYKYLKNRIENSNVDASEKEVILSDFSFLWNL